MGVALRRIFSTILVVTMVAESAALGAGNLAPRFQRVIIGTHRVHLVPLDSGKVSAGEADDFKRHGHSRAPEFVKDGFQTILFIWALAAIEIMRRKAQQDGIANPKTYLETAEMMPQVGLEILNDPTIYAGMAGAGFNAMALDVLMKSLKVPAFKSWFTRFLFFSAKTVIVLVGWEFGAQLWEEAAQTLPSNAEYAMSHDLGGLLGALLLAGSKSTPETLAKKNVAKKMLAAMGRILFMDAELRRQFIDHTMRRRIATGHFATLAAGLIGGGIVGSLVPGAGTVVMAGFGLLGAAASLMIPQEQKDQITQGIREFRKFTARQDLKLNAWQLGRHPKPRTKAALLRLRARQRTRLVTALFEEIEHKTVAESYATLMEIQKLYAAEVKRLPTDKTVSLLAEFFQIFAEQAHLAAGGNPASDLDGDGMKLFIENAAIVGFNEARTSKLFE